MRGRVLKIDGFFSIKKILLLCFFGHPCLHYGQIQKTDPSADHSVSQERIFHLLKQAEELPENRVHEKIILTDSVFRLSDQINFEAGIAKSCYQLGGLYLTQKKYLRALDYFEKSILSFDKIQDFESRAQALKRLGRTYYEAGEYTKAIDEYFKVLKYFETENNLIEIAGTYNNIGIIFHRGESDYEKALNYYNKALEELEKLPDSLSGDLQLRLYTNIGLSYFEIDDFEKAESFFLSSIEGNKKLQNDHIQIVNQGNLGLVYSGMEEYKKAESFFNQAIALSEKIGDSFSLAINTADLGKMYLQMAKTRIPDRNLVKKAIQNIEFALDIFKDFDDYRRYQGFSKDLSEAYEFLGDYRKALDVYKEYSFYKDSLFSDENSKALARQEISYEFSKRMDSIRLENEKRIAVKDAVLSASKKQKDFLVVGLLLLLIIGGLLYYQNFLRKTTNEKLSRLNRQLKEADRIKMQFFGIINHDLRSPISNIIKLLHLQQNAPEILDEKTRKRLQSQTVSSAENLLSSMEDLLLWSKGQMKNFQPDLKEVPVEVLFSDLSLFFGNHPPVKIQFENPEKLILKTDENYFKTIARNLTFNAIKALEQVPEPEIIWKAYSKDQEIILAVKDNGPGGSREDFKALYDDQYTIGIQTGLGLHLIRDLAQAIDCVVRVESEREKGTTIQLIFKKPENL